MERPRPNPGYRPRVLFIDDEPDTLEIYRYYCRQWGFESYCLVDPAAAVRTALEFEPDLVVCDVMMPRIDGFQVVEAFKANPRLSDLPVVMLTGGAVEVPDKVKGLGGGAIDYLIKPIDSEELRARINAYVKQRQRQQQQVEERELKVIRQTAAYLNHSINNLLATIQVAAEVAVDESDEDSRARFQMIDNNVRAIAEIVQKLKEIKHVIVKSYAGLEDMLDIEKSVEHPPKHR